MDYNTATAHECADWLAGDDGWELRTFGAWRRDKPGQREYEYLHNDHPYQLTLDAAAGALRKPWYIECLRKNSAIDHWYIHLRNTENQENIWTNAEDRLTAEYRAAVAARMEGGKA